MQMGANMKRSTAVCGLDCAECELRDSCEGCGVLGKNCMIATCCRSKGQERCEDFFKPDGKCGLKEQLLSEIRALGIADMEDVTTLYALKGSFVNLEYMLPGGQKVKFWEDDKIYLGNQVGKKGSDRCYGITADETYLLICEYGENGSDPEIVVFKRRK